MRHKPLTKIVIVVHQLLTSAYPAILHALQAHQAVTECYIFSALSENAHTLEADLGRNAFQDFATSLTQALSHLKQHSKHNNPDADTAPVMSVTVQHFPLYVCPLTNAAFVLPSSSPVTAARFGGRLAGYSNLDTSRPEQHGKAGSQDDDEVEEARRAELRVMAHCLVGFAAQQDLRLDTFAMGPASRALGDEICALTPPVGPNGSIPSTLASLILIDRQLDIVTPALHHSHPLDRIFSLPTRVNSSSSSSGRFQRGKGRASEVTLPVPGQRHESSEHGANSATERAEEVDAEVTVDAVQESDVRVAAGVNGVSKAEVRSQAASEGGSEAADKGGSETAREGWSDSEEASTSQVDGTVQLGAADHSQKSQQQSRQQPEQPQHQHQQEQEQQRPTFSLRSADVEVPLTPPGTPPGLLGSVLGSGQAREWLQFLVGRQPKDALLFLRKWVKDAARKEGLQLKAARSKLKDKAAIIEEIKGWTDALTAKPDAMLRQRSIVQLACAAVHALSGEASAGWAAMEQHEANLLTHSLDGSNTLASAVVDLLKSIGHGSDCNVELEDAMLLVVVAYCLAAQHAHALQGQSAGDPTSPWDPDQERMIKDAVVGALMQADETSLKKLSWLQDLPQRIQHHRQQQQLQLHGSQQEPEGEDTAVGEGDSQAGGMSGHAQDSGDSLYHERQQLRLEVQEAVEQMLTQLRGAAALHARAQERMQKSADTSGQTAADIAAEKLPLMRHLTERVLRRQNILGLYHATASIRSLLKSGLGRFGLQKQPHPADNTVVILFVVGGISMLELREVQQAVDNQTSQGGKLPQLLTGGTVLLRPRDLYRNLCSPKSTW
ncbi:hypothetical protein ABBQ38_008774 [Trebouxia sp. C0009 RCD-2024]